MMDPLQVEGTSAAIPLGLTQTGGTESPEEFAGVDGQCAGVDQMLIALARHVVMVVIETAPRDAVVGGEGMQLGVRRVADQM